MAIFEWQQKIAVRMQADYRVYYGKKFDEYTEKLVDSVVDLSKTVLNEPAAGSAWSPAQHVQHLVLSERGTIRLLQGPAEVVPDRSPDEKCALIDESFRIPVQRYQTHESLMPEAKTYLAADLLNDFVDIRAEQRAAFELSTDIEGECRNFKHPMLGYLTKIEWFFFSAIHGERHRTILTEGMV